jgi:hypothetical protein
VPQSRSRLLARSLTPHSFARVGVIAVADTHLPLFAAAAAHYDAESEQVPSLMVYDLLRQPPLEGVSAFAVRWDGAATAEV